MTSSLIPPGDSIHVCIYDESLSKYIQTETRSFPESEILCGRKEWRAGNEEPKGQKEYNELLGNKAEKRRMKAWLLISTRSG